MTPLVWSVAGLLLLALGGVGLLGMLGYLRGRMQPRAPRLDEPALGDLRFASVAAGGVGGVLGGAMAVQYGGPAAVPWLLIGALPAAGFTFLCVLGSSQSRRLDHAGRLHFGLAQALRLAPPGLRPAVTMLGAAVGLAVPLALLVLGGLASTHQAGALVHTLAGADPVTVGALLALCAAPIALLPRLAGRSTLFRLCSGAVALYALMALFLCAQRADATAEVLAAIGEPTVDWGAAVVGGIAGLIIASQAGLAAYAHLDEVGQVRSPAAAALASTSGPFVGALVAAITGLAIASAGLFTVPVHALAEGVDPDRPESRQLRIMERAHARGLSRNLEFGQLLVLPEDTPLLAGHQYPMTFRASPRGGKFGQVNPETNEFWVPNFQIARSVETVVFRSKHAGLRDNPAYDVRVPVKRSLRDAKLKDGTEVPGGGGALFLSPIDPKVKLSKLAADYDGPYVVFSDFNFVGNVAMASEAPWGVHKVMFEQRAEGDPFNPSLRQIIELGFRGPYFGGEARADRPLPPAALIARKDLPAAPGDRLELRLDASPRGLALGHVVPRAAKGEGELQVPPWDFLTEVTHVILRHVDDPSRDMRLPVTQRVAKDGTLRFKSANPEVFMFRDVDVAKEYVGPFLDVEGTRFEVEVREGTRFEPAYADHLALVFLHPQAEPIGMGTPGELYTPHPAELLQTTLRGPFIERQGAEALGFAFRSVDSDRLDWAGVGTLVALMALGGMVAAGSAGGRAVDGLLGPGAGIGYRIAFLCAAAFAPALTFGQLAFAIAAIVPPAAVIVLAAVAVVGVRRVEDV